MEAVEPQEAWLLLSWRDGDVLLCMQVALRAMGRPAGFLAKMTRKEFAGAEPIMGLLPMLRSTGKQAHSARPPCILLLLFNYIAPINGEPERHRLLGTSFCSWSRH